MNGAALMDGPLQLTAHFVVPRPKGHHGAKGSVRPSAPAYPITRPDTTKLLRALEDACTGILWRDDSQIVSQFAFKAYGEPARAEVEVRAL
jgi:Holliday junction resolvase RusA-like endonuclease